VIGLYIGQSPLSTVQELRQYKWRCRWAEPAQA